jgi:hypothetical protein
MEGVDAFTTDYTDGTITVPINSNVATGAGTSWLDNVAAGDIIKVLTLELRVKRVESDTRIILLNSAPQDINGETYIASEDNPLGFQLWYNANASYMLHYIGVKRVYDMINEDYDSPELPIEFETAIIDGTCGKRWKDNNDERWINQIALYSSEIQDLKANRFTSTPKSRAMPPNIPTRGGYI